MTAHFLMYDCNWPSSNLPKIPLFNAENVCKLLQAFIEVFTFDLWKNGSLFILICLVSHIYVIQSIWSDI